MDQMDTSTPAQDAPSAPVPAVPSAEGQGLVGEATSSTQWPTASLPCPTTTRRSAANMHLGALLGAGITLAATLGGRLAVSLLSRRKANLAQQNKQAQQEPSTASTPRQEGQDVVFSFGSPNVTHGSPRLVPKQLTAPAAPLSPASTVSDVAESKALPPGQLKQQLQLLQEVQEENARLHAFMKEYMATSDKMKVLEQENVELKAVASKLQTQLTDIKTKVVISNGDELSAFKDVVKDRFPAIARSVCSDLDFEKIKDTGSIDGSASMIDNNTRRKMGALSQLFAWANQPAAPRSRGASQVPSQVSTPRRSRGTQESVQSSDVLQMLNAFSAGSLQL